MSKTLGELVAEGGPTRIPKGVYGFVVIDCELQKSKADNPMYVLQCEIRDHPGIIDNGVPKDINGAKVTQYLTLTEKAGSFLAKFHTSAKLPLDMTIEQIASSPNPDLYKGARFNALAQSKPNPQIDDNKQPIIDPRTGQQLVYYRLEILDLL